MRDDDEAPTITTFMCGHTHCFATGQSVIECSKPPWVFASSTPSGLSILVLRQWLSPSRDWRSRRGRRISGEYPSRRDGTLTAYSKCGPLPRPQMAVTMRSTSKWEWERPAEMVPLDPGGVLMENKVARTHLRRADFEQWGLSEGCPGI